MVRYLLASASVLVMISGAAMAEINESGSKTITITRPAAHDMGTNKTITKRYVNHNGKLVTKSKTYSDGLSGSSVSRTRTVLDPNTGMSRSNTIIER
jgi:hypothetical protein